MKADYILLAVALMAVIVAVGGSFYTYNSIQTYKQTWFTGQAINTGVVLVNISGTAIINFTKNVINFSHGSVTPGALNATLTSIEGQNITGGNWSAAGNVTGFLIQNQGNTNVSLTLQVDNNDSVIGGTSPGFWWNVTPVTVDGTGMRMTVNNGSIGGAGNYSCLNSGNGTHTQQNDTYNLSVWTPVQIAAWTICNKFNYMTGNNTIRVDVRLQIPRDAPNKTFISTFTATATCCVP